jgi:hypothetical protein
LLELEDACVPLPPRVINQGTSGRRVHALLSSVVHHSKIGPPMTLWVISVGPKQAAASPDVRFTPKADK